MVLNILFLCVGICLLYWGSEWMVKGASAIALSFSIRPAIVGLTVVAFATSAPELLVSLIAACKGSSGISLGNILGSNVANIGLVLGASALLSPLAADEKLVNREFPFVIVVSGVFWISCLDGYLGRVDGLILLISLILFLVMGLMNTKEQKVVHHPPQGREKMKTFWFVFLILLGTAGLIIGADLMVNSAIFLARNFGLSEVFIGISIVAIGTSLPELATSLVAGAKGAHDISIGNVLGSNVFNIGLVIGVVGLFNPVSVDAALLKFEFPAMLVFSIVLYIFSRIWYKIHRIEGLCFLLCYFLFVWLSFWLGGNP